MEEKKVDMMIDGKKVSISETRLKSMIVKQKKVEVEINGKVFRVAEHLVEDMTRFGATLTRRSIKNPPKELLNMPEPKKVILPTEKLPDPPIEELPEPKVILPGNEVKPPELKTRKPRKK